MIRVLVDGENRHRLENEHGERVGWIHGRVIGFRAARSEDEAFAAVIAAWGPLEATMRQQFPGWPHHELDQKRLKLVRDGAYEWIADGTRPLARVHRPTARDVSGVWALEFVLPSYASEGVAMTVAQVLAHALARHLVADPAVQEGDAAPDDAPESAASASA